MYACYVHCTVSYVVGEFGVLGGGGEDFWQPNLIEVNSIHMVLLAKCKVEKGSSVIC